MGAFSDLLAQFDPVNTKRKGDQFELVCRWFLENDSTQYKALLRRVWLWREWPDRWSDIEAGIDLVAVDTEGRLWAIQAKAYENTITKSEVDKFLTESSRPMFAYRVLMATTDKLSPIAQRTMEDLGVSFIGLTELDEFPDWPTKLADLRPSKPPKPKRPFDYQRDALKDVVDGFKTADRGQLIMACGTGKTLVAWFLNEKLAAERTLVLVPSLSLLKQTLKEWRSANVKKPFEALPVCSDDTVRKDEDAAITHASYLGEPAETDPKKIAAFLRRRSGPRVVFSTYQSAPQIAEAFKLNGVPAFDLVIADEAHRIAGAVASEFATILDPKAIKAKRRLFMTATPRIYTERLIRQAKEAEDEIASMDDHTKFGEVFYRLGFGKAIERNLLSDYQVTIIDVDDTTYRNWAERGELVRLDGKTTDARSLAGQIGLAKAMRHYDLRRVISFHGRVTAAKDFAASMPAVLDWMPARQRPKGELWSEHASGAMSAGARHALLQKLKHLDDGVRGLLANARCLAEGVDVPALDGVAFIDPRRSEVDIVQAVGRAIRKSDTKTVGTIVIPVFIDTTEDPELALDSSEFKPVWDVIKALRAHDDVLGFQLDELRRELGRRRLRGRLRLPPKIRHDLSPKVSAAFASAFNVRLVEQTTQSWEFWFGLLEEYVAEHGTASLPRSYSTNGYQLGHWVNNQRAFRSRGILAEAHQQRLEQLSGWTWRPHTDRWEQGFSRLEEFVQRNGHSRVPRSNKQLSAWIQSQRQKFDEKVLDKDRQRRLESVEGWTWDPFEHQWEEGFTHLGEYVRVNGSARVPQSYIVNGFQLGAWVSTQRQRFAKGLLEEDRQRRLESIDGWAWDPFKQQWEEGFAHLGEYVRVNGSARVSRATTVGSYPLGRWVSRQRIARAQGRLDEDREQRLANLEGWTWDDIEARWEEGFDHLLNYAAQHGDTRVPFSYTVDGFQLGSWVNTQRNAKTKGTLRRDRKRRLERLDGWTWSAKSSQWENGFNRLLAYVEAHGDACVPVSYVVDGYKLGVWVSTQRATYAKGKLAPTLARRLQRLMGWTWKIK